MVSFFFFTQHKSLEMQDVTCTNNFYFHLYCLVFHSMEVPQFVTNSLIEKKTLVNFGLSLSQISCILHFCKNLHVGSSHFPHTKA